MIISHWSRAPWDAQRWPNFHPRELACKHCGEYYHDPDFLDRLQIGRSTVGKPFRINSGHRCFYWNRAVGGAGNSSHLRIATDINLSGHDRHDLKTIMRAVGMTGFGYYRTFLHIDRGRPRYWFGKGAKELWL